MDARTAGGEVSEGKRGGVRIPAGGIQPAKPESSPLFASRTGLLLIPFYSNKQVDDLAQVHKLMIGGKTRLWAQDIIWQKSP